MIDLEKIKWSFYIRFKVSKPLGVDQDSLSFLDKFTIKPDSSTSLKDAEILRLINLDNLIYRDIIEVSKNAEQALILAFAEFGIGISYPENLASEVISESVKKASEKHFIQQHTNIHGDHYEIPLIHCNDKFGVVLFQVESISWDSEVSQEIDPIDTEKLKKLFGKNYSQLANIFFAGDEFTKIETATSILTTSLFDDSLINKIILSMTVIEVLSQKISRPDDEIEALDYLVERINEATFGENIKASIKKGLSTLRYQSVGKSCKNIIKNILGNKDAKLFYELYDYRSQLVHTGSIRRNCEEMYKIYIDSHLLAKRLIAAYIERLSESHDI